MKKLKYILAAVLSAAILLSFPASVYAEESVPAESITEPSAAEPSPAEPDPEPQPEPEPSYEPEPEPSYEPEPEPSYYYEPEQSAYEESSAEESKAQNIADPFGAIKAAEILIPSDKPGYKAPEQSSAAESSESDHSAAAAVINGDNQLLSSPPIPSDDPSAPVPYNQQSDSNSVLMGIIFWSVIGVIVTTVLIVILNFKGNNSEFAFSRKRYHKGENRTSGLAGKYKIN